MTDDSRKTDELQSPPRGEPLLPAEKWLIAGSLLIGAVLLGALVWVSRTFFAAA